MRRFADLQLDHLEKLLVVDLVGLVQEDDYLGARPTWRARRTCSRSAASGRLRRYHEDRPVHLRGAGDHVLDIVGWPGMLTCV